MGSFCSCSGKSFTLPGGSNHNTAEMGVKKGLNVAPTGKQSRVLEAIQNQALYNGIDIYNMLNYYVFTAPNTMLAFAKECPMLEKRYLRQEKTKLKKLITRQQIEVLNIVAHNQNSLQTVLQSTSLKSHKRCWHDMRRLIAPINHVLRPTIQKRAVPSGFP